jgi:predicted amidohydrolase YtcJ
MRPATLFAALGAMVLLLSGAAASRAMQGRAADDGLLIYGGPIYTGNPAQPTAEAVLTRHGRIVFVGSLAEARKKAGPARQIDLKGAAAFPGFVDSHAHMTGIGLRELTLNLEGTASVEDLVSRLKAYAAAHPGNAPISGRGWIETHWPEGRFPNRADLDRAVPDRPVVLRRSDGHALVANSAALAMAGVTKATPDPEGGRILRRADGEPDGMLIDNAQSLVGSKMPAPDAAMKRDALARAGALYASRGWTGLDNMSVEGEDLAILQGLAAEGRLPIRTDNFMDPASSAEVLKRGPFADPTGRVRVRGIKLYADGALGSRGAALLAPYADAPDTSGLLVMQPAAMKPFLEKALAVGAQVATHAIGDRGNRLTLDGYGAVFSASPAMGRAARWRIEHAQIVSDADLPRFAKMGVIASMQPSHAIGDLYFAPARLGPERLKEGYRWRDFLESGAVVCAGTDAPVEKGDPLIEFYAAVSRHALNGFAGPDWHLEEAVTRAEALRMLTWAPAYAVFRERELGTLEVGKYADISVFSVDLMTAPAAKIPTAHAVLTVVEGRVVYQAR